MPTAWFVVLVAAGGLFLWIAADLLLVLFAGVLLAVFLSTLTSFVAQFTRFSRGWALTIVVIVLISLAALAVRLFAANLAEQAEELTERVPQAASQFADRLAEYGWGRWLLDRAPEGPDIATEPQVVERATGAAASVLHAVVGFVIVLFVGLYLAVNPWTYARGLLRLVPPDRRRRAGHVLFAAGYTLRWWLLGQLLAMVIVGTVMGVGLWLIGVPLALALGVLAGLLEFIPTLGPPLAVLPAVLLALVESTQMALYVLILYTGIQTFEAYLLTPMVQQRVVSLPPVITIAAQVLMAWTIGALGLLVAVPLVAVLMIAVQMLYVEDVLSDRMELPPEKAAREELEESGILDDMPE